MNITTKYNLNQRVYFFSDRLGKICSGKIKDIYAEIGAEDGADIKYVIPNFGTRHESDIYNNRKEAEKKGKKHLLEYLKIRIKNCTAYAKYYKQEMKKEIKELGVLKATLKQNE